LVGGLSMHHRDAEKDFVSGFMGDFMSRPFHPIIDSYKVNV